MFKVHSESEFFEALELEDSIARISTAIGFHVSLIEEENDLDMIQMSLDALKYIDNDVIECIRKGVGCYNRISDKCRKLGLLGD